MVEEEGGGGGASLEFMFLISYFFKRLGLMAEGEAILQH